MYVVISHFIRLTFTSLPFYASGDYRPLCCQYISGLFGGCDVYPEANV